MTSGESPNEPADDEPEEPAKGAGDSAEKSDEGDDQAEAGDGDGADGRPLELSDEELARVARRVRVPKLPDVKVRVPRFDVGSTGVLDGIRDSLNKISGKVAAPVSPAIEAILKNQRPKPIKLPDFPIDDSKWRTADAAEATAEAAKETAKFTGDLLEAMRDSVRLNEETRQDNTAAQRFTRRMSVASLLLSIAGVIFAGVALVFAAQPSPAPVVNIPPDPAPTINITVVPTPNPTTPAP